MKRLLFALCFTLFASAGAFAQETQIQSDTTGQQILNELQIIRGLQEESRDQRLRAVEERHRRDSLQNKKSEEDLSTDYGVMAKIEDNTRQHPMTDGWNFYGIAAFIIAVLSAAIAWYTFKAQQRTEGNTKKLSQDAQRKLLNELLRNLYRNYVITYTMRTKMKDIKYNGYPSEEHFEKLKIPMENIHLDAFYGEDEKFQRMHVLYLNLRNYNEEIDVALKHVVNPALKPATKNEDFDTLEFKVSYLTGKIIDTIAAIWGNDPRYKEEMRKAMELSLTGETNATDNIDVPGSDSFDKLSLETIKGTKYSKLYNEEELEKVCEIFNGDVHEERKKNARGAWKVRMIEY